MGDNDWLALSIICILVVIIFGGNLGLAIYKSGEIETPEFDQAEQPSPLSVWDWLWQGVGFWFAIVSFQVPNMPAIIGIIYILLTLMPAFIGMKFVRGSNT